MSISDPRNLPVEIYVAESRVGGKRHVQVGIMAWDSARYREAGATTDRWEGGKIYELDWTQLLQLPRTDYRSDRSSKAPY